MGAAAARPAATRPARRRSGRPSWYEYDGDQPRFRAALEGCESTLLHLLDSAEREQGLRPRRRWLLGSSQGGYCGAWLALRHPKRFAGMAIVGARVKTEWLAEEARRAAAAGFAAPLCHGDPDGDVSPEAAERSRDELAAAGLPVELHRFDGGHSLSRATVHHIAGWLPGGDPLDTRRPFG